MTIYIIKLTQVITSLLTGKRILSQPVQQGPQIIVNGAHCTEKLLLNTKVSDDFA